MLSPLTPTVPNSETTAFAARLLREFGDRFRLVDTKTEKSAKIDETVLLLMRRLLEDLAAGHAVSIIPYNHELTTFEAADILNVSRPYLIKLLEQGAIAHHKVGSHRRIRMDELLAFKAKMKDQTRKALSELTRLTQEHDI